MLSILRKSANTLPFKIFFAVLISSFAVWGIDALRGGGLDTQVATVGDSSISAVEYDRVLRIELDKALKTVGKKLPISTLAPMIQAQVYKQLVQQKLLDRLGYDMGLDVSGEVIKEFLLKEYSTDGQEFNPKKFKSMLYRAGYSEKQFIELIKKDLQRNFMARAIFPSIKVPSTLVVPIHKDYYTPRTYQAVIFTKKNIPAPKEPNEADLKNFYDSHKSLYQIPELRTVEAFIFDPKKQEDKGKKSLSKAEVQQAAIEKNHKLTQEVEDQLASGMTFKEVSKEYKMPIYKAKNVDIQGKTADKRNGIVATSIVTEMLTAAFELDKDMESEVITLEDGRSYIIKVTGIKARYIPEFKEVLVKVKKSYFTQMHKVALKEELNKYINLLNRGKLTLLALAKKLGLKIQTFSNILAIKAPPSGLTASVLEGIFNHSIKDYFGVISDNKVYVGAVTKLERVPTVSKARNKENMDSIREGLKSALAGAFFQAILGDVETKNPVTPNKRMLQNIMDSYAQAN